MDIGNLMVELRDDVDLLTRSDEWLEVERQTKSTTINRLIEELRAIQYAQRLKRFLQQRNLVAVQRLKRDCSNEVDEIVVEIMNLPDALVSLRNQQDTLDQVNAAANISGWVSDGYDVNTAANLRI